MKNIRLVLPLILLILLALVFTGCKGVIPSPGATEDLTISGKIKMPFTCCTIEEPIFEEEDTGHYTDAWSIIPDAVVELRDAEKCDKLLASTFSDENGEYTFDNVEPGLYIITAYCPVQKNYILKDVVEKKAMIGADAGIPDCDSTALALVIEYLNECFGNYNCFKKNSTIFRLARDIGEDIGEVDLPSITAHEDFGNLDDVDYEDLVDLVCDQLQGCCIGPGFTPGPGPGPTPQTVYTLTLLVDPEGAGTVTGAGDYNANITANISASANEGWQFVNWTGDASGTNSSTTVLMNSNKTATANFEEIPTYSVIYNGNGNTGGTAPTDSNDYEEGDEVTVLGPSDLVRTGYTFTGWNTVANGTGTSYTPGAKFNMPANDVTLYAQWSQDCYTLAVSINPSGSGSVTINPDEDCYNYGTEVTLTPVAEAGWTFSGWTGTNAGDVSGSGPSYTITMDEDKEVTANFTKIIIIDQDFHMNFGKKTGEVYWNLHVWTRITNNSSQVFNGTIEIKGTQTSTSTIVTHSGTISIDPGTKRYPGSSSTWTLPGFPNKSTTIVEIRIFDSLNNLLSYASGTIN